MMSGQTSQHEALERNSPTSCRRRMRSCSTSATRDANPPLRRWCLATTSLYTTASRTRAWWTAFVCTKASALCSSTTTWRALAARACQELDRPNRRRHPRRHGGRLRHGRRPRQTREICKYKDEYKFRLFVDDAHGFGTVGKRTRRRRPPRLPRPNRRLLGTFAKAMATIGAFVAGDEDVIEFLRYNMRSQTFAKSLPMPLVVSARKRRNAHMPASTRRTCGRWPRRCKRTSRRRI